MSIILEFHRCVTQLIKFNIDISLFPLPSPYPERVAQIWRNNWIRYQISRRLIDIVKDNAFRDTRRTRGRPCRLKWNLYPRPLSYSWSIKIPQLHIYMWLRANDWNLNKTRVDNGLFSCSCGICPINNGRRVSGSDTSSVCSNHEAKCAWEQFLGHEN